MKKYIIIGVTSLVVTLGGFFLFSKIKNNKEVEEKKNEENEEKKKETTTTKSSGTSSKWVKESFPLKRWCKGDNVKKLQGFLGVKEDGYFGTDTETALNNKYKVKECSKELFETITNPNDTKGSNPPLVVTDSEPSKLIKEYAVKLYNAMYRAGTDEESIRNVFTLIKTQSDLNALINYWSKVSNATKNKTLKDDLHSEMDEAEIEVYVNKPLRTNGINYQF